MLSNAYFLAKFRFDTAANEPAKNLQNVANIQILPILPILLGDAPRGPREVAGRAETEGVCRNRGTGGGKRVVSGPATAPRGGALAERAETETA